jgi:hypothetical protein
VCACWTVCDLWGAAGDSDGVGFVDSGGAESIATTISAHAASTADTAGAAGAAGSHRSCYDFIDGGRAKGVKLRPPLPIWETWTAGARFRRITGTWSHALRVGKIRDGCTIGRKVVGAIAVTVAC